MTDLGSTESICSQYATPRYHPRSIFLTADFVGYGCEHAASMSLWMVPGTHPDDPAKVTR